MPARTNASITDRRPGGATSWRRQSFAACGRRYILVLCCSACSGASGVDAFNARRDPDEPGLKRLRRLSTSVIPTPSPNLQQKSWITRTVLTKVRLRFKRRFMPLEYHRSRSIPVISRHHAQAVDGRARVGPPRQGIRAEARPASLPSPAGERPAESPVPVLWPSRIHCNAVECPSYGVSAILPPAPCGQGNGPVGHVEATHHRVSRKVLYFLFIP
jgi:hypothetical protein